MKTKIVAALLVSILLQAPGRCEKLSAHEAPLDKHAVTIFVGAKIIDGTGAPAIEHGVLMVAGDKIKSVSETSPEKIPPGAIVIDGKDLTIMPTMVNGHTHLGLLKGENAKTGNQSVENDTRQLKRFARYGVGVVVSLGTDEDFIYSMRERQRHGALSDFPQILTAGHGLGVKGGAPPIEGKIDDLAYRPTTPEEARKNIEELAAHHADVVKFWLEDLDGTVQPMKPEIYKAIIDEAHKNKMKVAAHIFALTYAKALVAAGVDVLAHSVRDVPVDDELIAAMKAQKTYLIPTLELDEACFIYKEHGVIDELKKKPFFVEALDPGILEYLQSDRYQPKVSEKTTLAMAEKNLGILSKAGINIGFGTDSGALPDRIQGYAEHRELELMVQAGLSPMEAIHCATGGSSSMLGISDKVGTLAPGKQANFIVLNADPLENISNTQKIRSVWLNGQKIPNSQH